MREDSATGVLPRVIGAVALVLIVALHTAVVSHVISRSLDHDEAEHLRAAEWMASGKMLYRDFVENHTPFLYLILERFARSEERRVGKECRYRLSPYQYVKKEYGIEY